MLALVGGIDMTEMSFSLVDHFDPDAPTISADHMGDGMFVLTETLEDGESERVCLTVAQISELFTRASVLYGSRTVKDEAA